MKMTTLRSAILGLALAASAAASAFAGITTDTINGLAFPSSPTSTGCQFNGSAASTLACTVTSFATSTVASPTGITGATGAAVMLGLAGQLTPAAAAGRAYISITGTVNVGTSSSGATLQCRFGAGAAPANNAALAGTAIGAAVTFINAASTTEKVPFACGGIASSLTPGTAIWIDLSVLNITSGTATITAATVTGFEF